MQEWNAEWASAWTWRAENTESSFLHCLQMPLQDGACNEEIQKELWDASGWTWHTEDSITRS